ncbi:MAG: NnrU family protein [Myxococcota bacterium]
MTLLIIGLVLFLGIHSSAIVGLRDRIVAAIGEGPWKGLYALISLIGFGAIVYGFGPARAASEILWVPPVWTRHLALTLMLPVFTLVAAAYFPGRISRSVGHPMLVGTTIWALAHLLANGGSHDMLLFGAFFVWAVLDLASFGWRERRAIPGAPPGPFNDGIVVVVGLGLYAFFLLFGHAWLFGVAPLPSLSLG